MFRPTLHSSHIIWSILWSKKVTFFSVVSSCHGFQYRESPFLEPASTETKKSLTWTSLVLEPMSVAWTIQAKETTRRYRHGYIKLKIMIKYAITKRRLLFSGSMIFIFFWSINPWWTKTSKLGTLSFFIYNKRK